MTGNPETTATGRASGTRAILLGAAVILPVAIFAYWFSSDADRPPTKVDATLARPSIGDAAPSKPTPRSDVDEDSKPEAGPGSGGFPVVAPRPPAQRGATPRASLVVPIAPGVEVDLGTRSRPTLPPHRTPKWRRTSTDDAPLGEPPVRQAEGAN